MSKKTNGKAAAANAVNVETKKAIETTAAAKKTEKAAKAAAAETKAEAKEKTAAQKAAEAKEAEIQRFANEEAKNAKIFASSNLYDHKVIKGKKISKAAAALKDYVTIQLEAAEAAAVLDNIQISTRSIIANFVNRNDENRTIAAASLDINADLLEACHLIAKERKDTTARIPVIKATAAAVSVFCTVRSEYYSEYYEASDKAAAAAEEAKAKAAERKAAKEAKEAAAAEAAEAAAPKPIKTAAEATIAILELLQIYGSDIDIQAVKNAIAAAEAAEAKAM